MNRPAFIRFNKAALQIATVFLFILMVAASCTKEQQLEKRLSSGDGKWNIDELQTNIWVDTVLMGQDTVFALGSYVFEDDGSGAFIDDTLASFDMFWANSEDEVAVIVDQEKIIWTVLVDEADKQEWYSAFPHLLPDSSILDSVELFMFLSR